MQFRSQRDQLGAVVVVTVKEDGDLDFVHGSGDKECQLLIQYNY